MSNVHPLMEQLLQSFVTNGLDAAAKQLPKPEPARKERFRFTEPKTLDVEQLNGLLDVCKSLYGEHGSNPVIRRHLNKMYAIIMKKDD